jgi:potassium-transporting ATPase potassium-binding subunit
LAAAGVHATAGSGSTGGTLQDKEQRFGIANTALWGTATTDASNDSVNGSHESFSGFGGMTPWPWPKSGCDDQQAPLT